MVRIDQLPPPRGPADATPDGISDYMQYAAQELARQAPEQFPTPEDIKTLAEDYGYSDRHEEVSSTLFFKETNPTSPASPILINIFYTTRGIMTHLPHPTQGYNSLWRSGAYDSLESLAMLFENPRTHTGKGYRQARNAVRGCAKCGVQKKRTGYSANQWKTGPGNAACVECVSDNGKARKQNKENGGSNISNHGSNSDYGEFPQLSNTSGSSNNGGSSFPRLSEDTLKQHDKKQIKAKSELERRQFNCPSCPEEGRGKNVFFKKVPAEKPVVKCPKCKRANRGGTAECERLYPIPKGEEKGYGHFRCTTCKSTWGSSRAIGNIGQQCHVCEIAGNFNHFVKPFRMEVFKSGKGGGIAGGGARAAGRRMKRQPREPIGEDEETANSYGAEDSQRFQYGAKNSLADRGGNGGGGAGQSFDWVEQEEESIPETAPAASRLSQYKSALQHKCEGCMTGVCRSRKLPISGIHDVHDGDTVSTSASVLTNSEIDKSEFIDRDIDFDDWEEEEDGVDWVTMGKSGKMLRG